MNERLDRMRSSELLRRSEMGALRLSFIVIAGTSLAFAVQGYSLCLSFLPRYDAVLCRESSGAKIRR